MDEEQKPYDFIKEVIKKQPKDRLHLIKRILAIICGAALFGVVAAIAFAAVYPKVQCYFVQNEPPKVNIPQDEVPTPVITQMVTPTAAPTDIPQITPTPTPESSLVHYKKLYQEMMAAAEPARKSMVTVIGITNSTDWFNQEYESRRQISGMIVAETEENLFILAEYRIVDKVERIQVRFYDSVQVDARYQKHDPETGLTILKVPCASIPAETKESIQSAPLGSSYTLMQGEPVMALGSPAGYAETVAYGVITSMENKVSKTDVQYALITTDIVGNKEGSGTLINLDGEVVGVMLQSCAADNNGIVSCVGISQLKQLINQLANNEKIPFLGINGREVGRDISDKTGVPAGVWVERVEEDSPAMLAGIQKGDVIVKLGNFEVENMTQYHNHLSECTPEQKLSLVVMRKGSEGYVEIVFDVMPGAL